MIAWFISSYSPPQGKLALYIYYPSAYSIMERERGGGEKERDRRRENIWERGDLRVKVKMIASQTPLLPTKTSDPSLPYRDDHLQTTMWLMGKHLRAVVVLIAMVIS